MLLVFHFPRHHKDKFTEEKFRKVSLGQVSLLGRAYEQARLMLKISFVFYTI